MDMADSSSPDETLPEADEVFVFPASPAQTGLWFLLQLTPGSTAYNVPATLRLTGQLSASALERALRALCQRHETLRTTFDVVDGEVSQIVHPEPGWTFERVDLRALPAEARAAECQRRCAHEADRPFDLHHGPLLRPVLFTLDERDHVLLLMMHHIITDGWSMGVLARELAALYVAALTGRPDNLPELPLQYADYAIWHRDWLANGMLERQLAFWRQELAGIEGVLELPADKARPPVLSDRGAHVQVTLPAPLVAGLRRVGSSSGATLFMTLHAAFATLLHRYSGSDEIVVGTPAANRGQASTHGLIGFFANVLVLRASFEGDPSFAQLLRRLRDASARALDHQDTPFDEVVRAVQTRRDIGRHPLFQAMISMDNTPATARIAPGLHLSRFDVPLPTAQHELSLTVEERGDQVALDLEYSTDLFEAATASDMLAHFAELCRSAVADPLRPVSSLPLLAEAERQRLLSDCSRVEPAVVTATRALELIEAQVDRVPDHTAVIDGARRLSYAELDARANAIHAALVAAGVRAGDLVAVALPRSADLAAGLLAVWKCDAAYLPLDPEQPSQRIDAIVRDAGVRVALTDATRAELFPAQVRRVLVEQIGPSGPRVRSATGGEALAYVIYTSGSTGRPKGVMVSHRGLVNYLTWAMRTYAADGKAAATVHSTIAFDLTVLSLFLPLMVGAPAHLVPERDSLQGLMDALVAHPDLRLINLTPAHLELLVQLLPAPAWAALHDACIVVGGEALSRELVERVRGLTPRSRIVNEYGPTETVVGCAFHEVGDGDGSGASMPIGRPIAGTRLYVLDDRMEPVPVGVNGELYIGGACVGYGYLGDPVRTALAFAPDPFATEPGARLYRSGDLARYRRDGRLEFLGRRDQQLKVRGYRIEPAEVEAVLRQHEGVREAVVLAARDAGEQARLVAYVVGDVDPRAVRAHAGAVLPDYMVPSVVVPMEALPLTPNGKVDRKALPRPQISDQTSYVAPRTPQEERLAAIWASVLGLDRIGIDDDFFAMGGHSLLATRAVSRIRAELDIELPLRTLFERPTVRRLAEAVFATRTGADLPPMVHVDRRRPLALSYAQARLWFLQQMEPDNPFYNVPAAVRLRGTLDVARLRQSFAQITQRHEVLRTTFAEQGGRPVQVIHDQLEVDFEEQDLRHLGPEQAQERIRGLVSETALQPFDLARGPLMRVRLMRVAEREHVLALNLHHIASDGWSIGVLMRELQSAYAGIEQEPLAIQYADFAAWQRQWLEGGELARQLDYWKQALAGAPQVLDLPADRRRPAVSSYRGAHLRLALSAGVVDGLQAAARAQGGTLFMSLYAAFAALLARYAQQSDLVIGTPVANRMRVETEGLIGFFVNTLPVRTDVSGNPRFEELVQRVKQQLLAAYAHQDVPYERLVEELRPERDLSRNPIFQVLFVLQNAPEGVMAMPGLELERLELEEGTSKFDLALMLEERGAGLDVILEYSTDLFSEETARALIAQYVQVCARAAAEPARPLSELVAVSDRERVQQLEQWNRTARDLPYDTNVETMIAAHAEQRPEATAVADGHEQLSYRQLQRRANAIAHRLAVAGVRPDDRVALYAHRGARLITGVLGILQAGGAYVPIEPRYPVARVAQMVRDSGARCLLVDPAHHDRVSAVLAELPPDERPDVQLLGSEETPERLPERAGPRNLAYVIFTSGSTGRPKGAMVERRGLANHLCTKVADLALGATDCVVQNASQCFDISVWQMLAALVAGGRVRVVDDETALDPEALFALAARESCTALQVVPSVLRSALDSWDTRGASVAFPHLRWLVVAGEALAVDLCRRWLARVPAVPLVNFYGPTECTDNVTIEVIRDMPGADDARVAIGRPLSNVRLHVLDDRMQLVPVGVPGELYIGGLAVGRGYLGDPVRTATSFMPDPFATVPGARLYRTGDLVRYRRDGRLEFLGRRDHQVKVRGYRIELGEVEAVLRQLEGVRDAVVLAVRDAGEQGRLVAYVVGDVDPRAVRARAGKVLPDYMVPSVVVPMAALPLNPNGKVDRKALPRPQLDQTGYVAPRTPAEERLAAIWAAVLGAERVGIDDDFFAIGGHSLLGAQVVSRIRAELDVELPLRTLFERPTVRGLAESVVALAGDTAAGERGARRAETERPRHEDVAPAGRSMAVRYPSSNVRAEAWLLHPPLPSARVRLFCFPHAGGGALSYRSWIERLAPDIDVVPVQLPGREARISERPFERMAPLVDALTPVIAMHAGQPFALFGHSMGAMVGFELAHALAAQGLVPAHLFISGCPSPELAHRDWVAHGLSDDELLQMLRGMAGTPASVLQDPGLLKLFLPMIRADYTLCETYRYQPRPPLSLPITCMGGIHDPGVTLEHLNLWQAHTTSQAPVHRFPGGHFFLHDPGNDVLGVIVRRLADVGA